MKNYVLYKLPSHFTGTYNWYVSPQDESQPIHVFRTQVEAIAFARLMPPYEVNGLRLQHIIDWIDARHDLRTAIHRTRTIINMRLKTIPVHVLPATGPEGSFLLASVKTGNVLTTAGKFGDGDLMLFETEAKAAEWVNSQPRNTPRHFILVEA